MSILKPIKGKPLTFWFSGGEIIWHGATKSGAANPTPITRQMAEDMRELFQEDVTACWTAGDHEAARHAVQLWVQLTAAMDAQDAWKRLFNPKPVARTFPIHSQQADI